MNDSVALKPSEAVPLIHAMIARIAQDRGVRVLLIKGPILAIQGLRVPRQSGDIDVLCDPTQVGVLEEGLRQAGWRSSDPWPNAPRVLPRHSIDYIHDRWPASIDVHHRFPGFYAPDLDVFEILWEVRTTEPLATQPVPCCSLIGHSLIQALHLLRNPEVPVYQADLTFLVATLRERLDADDLSQIAEIAAATGAADTLSPFLDQLGAPAIGRGTTSAADLHEWDLRRIKGENQMTLRLEELRITPIHHWPGILWRASAPLEIDLSGRHVNAVQMVLMRIGRLVHGVRPLPRGVSRYARMRRVR